MLVWLVLPYEQIEHRTKPKEDKQPYHDRYEQGHLFTSTLKHQSRSTRIWCSRKCGTGSNPPDRPTAKALELLNKLSVSELAELSGTSKSYISQVKHGKCRPSEKLLAALIGSSYVKKPDLNYFKRFMESRAAMGCSPKTLAYYRDTLTPFVDYVVDYPRASRQQIEKFLNSIPPNANGLGTRNAYYRAIRTFYLWLHNEYGLEDPMQGMRAPIVSKLILPALTREQVQQLLESAECLRDKAIIALFTESGLRLSELANIRADDIDWEKHTISVIGKGRKQALAPFGALSEQYLRQWLSEYSPNGSGVWGINRWGITTMLGRLRAKTRLKCNPHVFRRTFACLLRKNGVDCLVIKDLGRWESVHMVERYTRSFVFADAMKFYKGTLG
jgi:integrase/recombinase XerC